MLLTGGAAQGREQVAFFTGELIVEGFIDLYVHNTDDLDKLIRELSKVKGIERVKRVEIK